MGSFLTNRLLSQYLINQAHRLGLVQAYLLYVLTMAIIGFSVSSGDRDFETIACVIATCILLCGVYAVLLSILNSHAVAAIYIVGALVLLPLMDFLRYPLMMIGIVGFVLLVRSWRELDLSYLLALPLVVIAIFGSSIHTDFEYQKYLNGGSLSIDSLFHTAVAAMYKNYGIASVGLDGLAPISYHTLSHKIMAGISVLSGVSVMATYGRLYFVLGPVLLIFALAGLATQARPLQTFSNALLSVVALMLAIICLPFFKEFAFWDSYMTSESYLVGMVLLAAALSLLYRYRDFPQKDSWLYYSLILLVLSGASKGSVGVLGFCVFSVFGVLLLRTVKFWGALFVGAIIFCYLMLSAAQSGGENINIRVFDFISAYAPALGMASGGGKIASFIFVHFLTVWIFVFAVFFKNGKSGALSNEFLTVVGLFLPALLVVLFLQVPGGSAYYFSNVPALLSLAFVAGYAVLRKIRSWVFVLSISGIFFLLFFWGESLEMHQGLIKLFVLALAIFFLTNFNTGYRRWVAIAFLANVSFRFLSAEIMPRTIYSDVAQTDVSPQVAQLILLRNELPRDVILRVTNSAALTAKIGCPAFWAIPAILEHPVINGLPTEGWCAEHRGAYYGLIDYKNPRKADVGLKEFSVELK